MAGDFVFGTLGTGGERLDVVAGGTGPETSQALRNIERILTECGAGKDDVVKVNVFLADMDSALEMNEEYQGFFGADPPARITVGGVQLALGAAAEIDCVAYKPAG